MNVDPAERPHQALETSEIDDRIVIDEHVGEVLDSPDHQGWATERKGGVDLHYAMTRHIDPGIARNRNERGSLPVRADMHQHEDVAALFARLERQLLSIAARCLLIRPKVRSGEKDSHATPGRRGHYGPARPGEALKHVRDAPDISGQLIGDEVDAPDGPDEHGQNRHNGNDRGAPAASASPVTAIGLRICGVLPLRGVLGLTWIRGVLPVRGVLGLVWAVCLVSAGHLRLPPRV